MPAIVSAPSHPRRLPHQRHQPIAVAQEPLRAALIILHRHRGDAAVALVEEARLESIELQMDEQARDLRRGVEAQRSGPR